MQRSVEPGERVGAVACLARGLEPPTPFSGQFSGHLKKCGRVSTFVDARIDCGFRRAVLCGDRGGIGLVTPGRGLPGAFKFGERPGLMFAARCCLLRSDGRATAVSLLQLYDTKTDGREEEEEEQYLVGRISKAWLGGSGV